MRFKKGDLVKVKKTAGTKFSGKRGTVVSDGRGAIIRVLFYSREEANFLVQYLKPVLLYPFDIERAKSGDKMVLADGRKVTNFKLIESSHSHYQFSVRFEGSSLPIAYKCNDCKQTDMSGYKLFMSKPHKLRGSEIASIVIDEVVEEVDFEDADPITERIICSAIYYDDRKKHPHQPKNINTGVVVAGRRHHNCVATMGALHSRPHSFKLFEMTQGFITSADNYVGREEGLRIAREAGQILNESEVRGNRLHSEDLY